jgi:hypothetical protein
VDEDHRHSPAGIRRPRGAPQTHAVWRHWSKDVTKAIRTKVLESYRNGQKAGLPKGGRYGR